MFVYRIAMAKFASDLSGEGARLFGGRWNSVGKACLYTSDHSALAMLEVAVHHTAGNIPPNLKLIRMEVPDELIANSAQVLSTIFTPSKTWDLHAKLATNG